MENSERVVYMISHPISDELVYIGQTSNIVGRGYNHSNNQKNVEMFAWVKSLKTNKLNLVLTPLFIGLNKEDALRLEIVSMYLAVEKGARLLNKQCLSKKQISICQNNKGLTGKDFLLFLKEDWDNIVERTGFNPLKAA